MLKHAAAAFLIGISFVAHAYEEPTFDEFFSAEENMDKFNKLSESGKIGNIRAQMISICKTWSTDKEDLDERCECVTKEISKFSDEQLFYTSILAFNRYQAKVDALTNNDKERFEELKLQFEKSPLVPSIIEYTCEK